MKSRNTLPLAAAACLLLSACGESQGYPSLAIRDSERVSGSMDAPAAAPFTPAPATPATLDQLESLHQSAREAHNRFVGAANEARSPVSRAVGSAAGSDSWAQAQVAVASLESIRSDVMVALADIDRLFVDAAVGGGEIAQLEAARNDVAMLVDEENRRIAELLSALGR